MSLVAYASSSDEDSDNEKTTSTEKKENHTQLPISDDDDDYVPLANSIQEDKHSKTLSLPKPIYPIDELHGVVMPIFAKLPMPKDSHKFNDVVEEEDDEFLHKKAVPLPETLMKKPSKPQVSRAKVKITIPSMKEFADVDDDIAKSEQQLGKQTQIKSTKKSGLLEVLPQAKSEQNFAKNEIVSNHNQSTTNNPGSSIHITKSALIPDTVRNRRPAQNTEGVDGVKCSTSAKTKTLQKPSAMLVDCSDASGDDDDDDDAEDFFALNDDEKLPEVNANELNVMIAKRAAKMAVATSKYLEMNATSTSKTNEDQQPSNEEELKRAQKRFHETQLNEEALHALVGSKSKRRRQQNSKIEIVDISGNQVLPDRDEWMRTALASSTTYQPTGVLVDEEPASGTRRKHQITYLAHKAKANEAELQAMWAANRQNRRATQSKYGF